MELHHLFFCLFVLFFSHFPALFILCPWMQLGTDRLLSLLQLEMMTEEGS